MKKWKQSNWKLNLILLGAMVGGLSLQAQNTWRVPGDFPNIQSALDNAELREGDTIQVGPGEFAGAVITRSVALIAQTNTVISSPATNSVTPGVGFLFPGNGLGSGSVIQGFQFTNLNLPILSLGADDVVVYQNILRSPQQGITSLGGTNATPMGGRGNRWIIAQNEIHQPSAYGILLEEVVGNELSGNIIIRNAVLATNDPAASTNFTVTGIAMIGNANAGAGSAFRNNSIVYNQVSLTNNNPTMPPIGILILLQNANTNSATNAISGNLIARNDLNAAQPIYFEPAGLEEANRIFQILVRPGTLEGSTPDTNPTPAPGPTPGEDPQRTSEIEVVEGTISGPTPPTDPNPAPNPAPGEDPARP